jgi:hypothetical protein
MMPSNELLVELYNWNIPSAMKIDLHPQERGLKSDYRTWVYGFPEKMFDQDGKNPSRWSSRGALRALGACQEKIRDGRSGN